LGNFINGELWGRVTAPDAPWAMIFPQAWQADSALVRANPALQSSWLSYFDPHTQSTLAGLPRHASQLYQFALEGLMLFVILWLFARKPRPTGAVSGLFLVGYGSFRFIAEFAREPDDFLGLLAAHLSMGQWLSLPMIAAGLAIMVWAYRHKRT
jgi:phosphatidylglycerol:prolipoprotein diacylglycerol transferase